MKKTFKLGTVMGLVSIGLAVNSSAIIIDFETYSTGPIGNGYNGWMITNPSWDQSVVNSGAISGSQSWRVSRAVASGSFGDQPFSPALPQSAGEAQVNKLFTASWLMQATVPIAITGDGVSIAMDNGTGARGNQIRVQGIGGMWNVIVDDYVGNAFTTTTIGTLSSTAAMKISWTQVFNPGYANDQWTVYVNDALAYTGVGWEDYFVDNQPGIAPVSYDRLLFRAGGASIVGATGVLIDDINYSASAVPEPATYVAGALLLLPFGISTLRMLRKKQTA